MAGKNLIKNCLFANIGQKDFWHSIYISSRPGTSDSSNKVERCIIISAGAMKDSCGYGIHFWHDPDYTTATKNFVSLDWGYAAGANEGGVTHSYLFRDNVLWNGCLINITYPDTLTWKHILWGPSNNPGVYSVRANYVMDSTRYMVYLAGDSKWYPFPYHANTIGAIPSNLGDGVSGSQPVYTWVGSQCATYLGNDSTTIETAITALATSLGWTKTAANVYNDATVWTNWQILVDAVDFWQGTAEEAIGNNVP
jgi:hypothetical protein